MLDQQPVLLDLDVGAVRAALVGAAEGKAGGMELFPGRAFFLYPW
jgi:hypothetical protein